MRDYPCPKTANTLTPHPALPTLPILPYPLPHPQHYTPWTGHSTGTRDQMGPETGNPESRDPLLLPRRDLGSETGDQRSDLPSASPPSPEDQRLGTREQRSTPPHPMEGAWDQRLGTKPPPSSLVTRQRN